MWLFFSLRLDFRSDHNSNKIRIYTEKYIAINFMYVSYEKMIIKELINDYVKKNNTVINNCLKEIR